MATTPSSNSNFVSSYAAKTICQIVGWVCLTGFAIDLLALALPPDPLSLEWRINFLQQLGDRSIILLFGTAFVLYGLIDARRWLRQFSLMCLIIGILFHLSCLLIIRDGLVLQRQTVENISSQASQIQSQIQQSQSGELPEDVTPEQLQQFSELVSTQAETLKQNTRTGITKVGLASAGNLVVVGLGLISLGRYGMRLRRGKV